MFGNDGDPDGDQIVVSEAGGVPAGTVFLTAGGGTVVVQANGMFEYTPAPGFISIDSFEYTIVDPSGATDTATVVVEVTENLSPLVNSRPDANDDAAVTPVNTIVTGNALSNDTDINGDSPLMVTAVNGDTTLAPVTTPSGGTLTILADGFYTYTPGPLFVGTESVTYTIDDGQGGTDTATIYLSVFNTPPQAEDDINLTSVNVPVDGNVLTNDSSDPGETLVVSDGSGTPLTGPTTLMTDAGGEIVINSDGSYTYTPPTDFVGDDSITIEVCDQFGACVESELSLTVVDTTVNPNNTPPIAQDDNFETFSDPIAPSTVSYTHLTLPTICSV